MNWSRVSDVYLFGDSCNVYAVEAPEGMVVVNAGTGKWLDHLAELPKPVAAVVCTHFFRDHTAGAARAARQGIPIYAPYWEQEQFSDPLGLFQRRETYIVYDNIWDFFSPIEPIPVTRWLRDWETVRIAGLEFKVLPTAGMTIGAITLLCQTPAGKAAFCGEVIHSPGKVARLAPLQQLYNDLCGAVSLVHSVALLRKEKPDLLLPSLGRPMLQSADDALAQLDRTLRFVLSDRPDLVAELALFDRDELIQVSEHIYQSTFGCASTFIVLSRTGKAMSIDYGHCTTLLQTRNYTYPRHRRSKLHAMDALKSRFGIDGLDLVIPTHFHDDHVSGIPLLQRLYGTKCWVGENFARILANPAGYNFPCTWPEPIDVTPQPLGVPLKWEEYTFVLEPVHGHTRWSNLVFFEADGKRVCATGDQHFFHAFTGPNKPLGDYDGSPYYVNWVYRNGAMLDSMRDSSSRLLERRPEIILPGHGNAYRTNEAWLAELRRCAENYEASHRRAMPLEARDEHFEVDSRAAWLEPYRVHVPPKGVQLAQPVLGGGVVPEGMCAEALAPIRFRAFVRNPLPQSADIDLRLVGPDGWTALPVRVSAPPRAEVSAELAILPPPGTSCRRQPVAMEMSIGRRTFGQVAEALVTIGQACW